MAATDVTENTRTASGDIPCLNKLKGVMCHVPKNKQNNRYAILAVKSNSIVDQVQFSNKAIKRNHDKLLIYVERKYGVAWFLLLAISRFSCASSPHSLATSTRPVAGRQKVEGDQYNV